MCCTSGSLLAFREAVELHKRGDLSAAEARYRLVLLLQQQQQQQQQQPQGVDPEALHNLGALLVQLKGAKRAQEAISHIKRAIQLQPGSWKYRNTLGVAYEACGQHGDAVDAFQRAHEKEPGSVKVLMNLARALRECGRSAAAAEAYGKVAALEPDHPSAHHKRAMLLRRLGRTREAAACLREHLRLHPDDPDTRFWIAAMSGNSAEAAACPEAMVAGLFDDYAGSFEEHLVGHLEYRTPQLLMELLLGAAGGGGGRWQRCVDLGCGTGLMAPLLRGRAAWLEGVDLSGGMVAKARERGLYDRLDVAELVAHLRQHAPGAQRQLQRPGQQARGGSAGIGQAAGAGGAPSCCGYDLVIAADVFVYLGDLRPVLQAAADAAQPGAVMCFSTEQMQEARGSGDAAAAVAGAGAAAAGAGGLGYEVQPTGRYVHSQRYLSEVAAQTGWGVAALSTAAIRKNKGQPVMGNLCVLRLQR